MNKSKYLTVSVIRESFATYPGETHNTEFDTFAHASAYVEEEVMWESVEYVDLVVSDEHGMDVVTRTDGSFA